jgi:nucleotide-binding universal stress UspA family protein
MTEAPAAPVMVGIDGSTASVRAAVWAADEAALRDTVLDLIYVVDPEREQDPEAAMEEGRRALHRAWEAVTKSGKDVKVESELLQGNPVLKLADAAQRAALLCLGHKGRKDSAPLSRGATASNLARMAPTSVAVIRRWHIHRRPTFHRWIVALLDESAASHVVLQTALDEAVLRAAPVLALTTWSTNESGEARAAAHADDIRAKMDRYLKDSQSHQTDLEVCALPMPDDLVHMLEQSANIEQLFVVGSARHDLVDELTSDRARKAMRGTHCSVLVVHDDTAPEPSTDPDELSDS